MKPSEIRTPAGRAKAATGIATAAGADPKPPSVQHRSFDRGRSDAAPLAVDCLIYSGTKMTNATGRRPWREREIQQTVVRAIRAGEQHPRELAQ